MNEVRFSVLVYLKNPDPDKYREMLLSLAEEGYSNFELYLLQASGASSREKNNDSLEKQAAYSEYARMAAEIFPREGKVHFRQIGQDATAARAYNTGIRFASGDYVIFLGQEDMLSPDYMEAVEKEVIQTLVEGEAGTLDFDDLRRAASGNKLRQWKETAPDLIYTDHDELVQGTRMTPHFKGGFNRELLLQSDYIGCSQVISMGLLRKLGFFDESLDACELYDYMLRIEGLLREGTKLRIVRIPRLLYHQRIKEVPESVFRRLLADRYNTYLKVAEAHRKKYAIEGQYKRDAQYRFWRLERKGRDYRVHRGSYIFVKDRGIEARGMRVLPRLYAHLREPDVAVVALKITNREGRVDNCGFIYDEEGISYPACAKMHPSEEGYAGRLLISQEISCADPGCCLIDAAVYKKLRGFRKDLAERDRMLDFCLRARAAGYRIIYEPQATARRKEQSPESSRYSHEKMMKMYGPSGENTRIRFGQGDPYYDPNLPMGVTNYTL